jgi:polynucleotide 5'-hydroxyl-kinase GRC3/NOL9
MTTARTIAPGRTWNQLLTHLDRGTILVVGGVGAGKTTLARWLLGQLDRGLDRVALVDCDPAQPSVGVPGCLGLAMTSPWEAPESLWFVGSRGLAGNDPAPGRLLASVVGAARLAARARHRGAQAVILDTAPPADGANRPGDPRSSGALSRLLEIHLAHAAGVDQVIALERNGELAPLLSLLASERRRIQRLPASAVARPGEPDEQRTQRQTRFAAHLLGASSRLFSPRRIFTHDWRPAGRDDLPQGRVLGLLDGDGFCLGLGLIEEVHDDRVAVLTPVDEMPVVRIQVGDFRLDPEGRELP